MKKKKPNGYWHNKKHCHGAASKCKTRMEFKINYSSAYENSRKNGWLDEFFPKQIIKEAA